MWHILSGIVFFVFFRYLMQCNSGLAESLLLKDREVINYILELTANQSTVAHFACEEGVYIQV